MPPELTVVLAKVTIPEFTVIPPWAVRSLETSTLPAPLAVTAVAVMGPLVITTAVETGLAKLNRLGLTPPLSTVTVAALVKAVLSPVRNAADAPPGTVFHTVLAGSVFQSPLALAKAKSCGPCPSTTNWRAVEELVKVY
jgi:hypothetical protein